MGAIRTLRRMAEVLFTLSADSKMDCRIAKSPGRGYARFHQWRDIAAIIYCAAVQHARVRAESRCGCNVRLASLPRIAGKLIVSAIDLAHGRGAELFRFSVVPHEDTWWLAISPDGGRFAATRSQAGPILVLSAAGQVLQQIQVSGWSSLQSFDWAADGKGFLVVAGIPNGCKLLARRSSGQRAGPLGKSRRLRRNHRASIARWAPRSF